MDINVYIARGSENNIFNSVINGVDKDLVENVLGIRVPQETIDSSGRVHLWGVPRSGAEKNWKNIKRGDIIIILPIRKFGKTIKECYITIVVGKYPENVIQEEINKSEKLSRIIWEPYRKKQNITESYPFIIFLDNRISVDSIDNVLKVLGKDTKSLIGYRESLQRIKAVFPEALQKLKERVLLVPDTSTILKLMEETYLELSARYGWNPINCSYYSSIYNVCYGAPIMLGNKSVWGREGLFEELNKKLIKNGYTPITWDHLKQLLKSIEKGGVVYVSWFASPNTRQIEPHDIMIWKPILHGASS